MKYREFMESLDQARVVEAIRHAEASTTGEIRVCVAREAAPDPLAAARAAFGKLGMALTRDRNGVLVLVAPVSQTCAILGDDAIHARICDQGWTALAEELSAAFRAGRATEGLETVVSKIGEDLARHFPKRPGDTNERPDTIAPV